MVGGHAFIHHLNIFYAPMARRGRQYVIDANGGFVGGKRRRVRLAGRVQPMPGQCPKGSIVPGRIEISGQDCGNFASGEPSVDFTGLYQAVGRVFQVIEMRAGKGDFDPGGRGRPPHNRSSRFPVFRMRQRVVFRAQERESGKNSVAIFASPQGHSHAEAGLHAQAISQFRCLIHISRPSQSAVHFLEGHQVGGVFCQDCRDSAKVYPVVHAQPMADVVGHYP